MDRRTKLTFWLSAYCFILLIIPLAPKLGFVYNAAADGLAQESIPGTSSQGHPLVLTVQINPPYVSSESNQTRSLYVELQDFDHRTALPNTTYEIWLSRVSVDSGAEFPILHDRFRSQNGPVLIKGSFPPNNNQGDGSISVNGKRETSIEAWVADLNNTIEIASPIFSDAGLYHIRVEILGIGADALNQNPPPEFNSWLNLGYALNSSVLYHDRVFNVTITSYYDKVNDYRFDEKSETISWSTPFFWNLTQINAGNTFVHEEIKVPKSFIDMLNISSFSGSVNSQELNGAGMSIDSYTFPNATVIHYVINKHTLLELAANSTDSVNEQDIAKKLSFNLFLNVPLQAANFNGVGTETTNRHASVWVGFTPSQLTSDPNTDLRFQFYAIEKGNQVPIVGDVHYNLKIFGSNGIQLVTANDLLAANATDERILNFSSSNNFRVVVEITGIETKSGFNKQFNGVAISEIAVPEFQISQFGFGMLATGGLVLFGIFHSRVSRLVFSKKGH
jgi:hypothetical protein